MFICTWPSRSGRPTNQIQRHFQHLVNHLPFCRPISTAGAYIAQIPDPVPVPVFIPIRVQTHCTPPLSHLPVSTIILLLYLMKRLPADYLYPLFFASNNPTSLQTSPLAALVSLVDSYIYSPFSAILIYIFIYLYIVYTHARLSSWDVLVVAVFFFPV